MAFPATYLANHTLEEVVVAATATTTATTVPAAIAATSEATMFLVSFQSPPKFQENIFLV
jgi:hypothetical protein